MAYLTEELHHKYSGSPFFSPENASPVALSLAGKTYHRRTQLARSCAAMATLFCPISLSDFAALPRNPSYLFLPVVTRSPDVLLHRLQLVSIEHLQLSSECRAHEAPISVAPARLSGGTNRSSVSPLLWTTLLSRSHSLSASISICRRGGFSHDRQMLQHVIHLYTHFSNQLLFNMIQRHHIYNKPCVDRKHKPTKGVKVLKPPLKRDASRRRSMDGGVGAVVLDLDGLDLKVLS
ncbi:hypothetical protein LXL04_037358 [Taraxacum kok-saghyz]